MKRLSFLIVAVCLLSLCCSAFAQKVTNETVSGKSGATIKEAYDTTGAYPSQTLQLSDNVTETESTNLVGDSTNVSNITLNTKDSNVYTVTGPTQNNLSTPIFTNQTDGSTTYVYLNNVAINGILMGDTKDCTWNINLEGTGGNLTFTGDTNTTGGTTGAISGYGNVHIATNVPESQNADISFSGYTVIDNIGAAVNSSGVIDDEYTYVSGGKIEISNNAGNVSFTNNTAHNNDTTSSVSIASGGAVAAYKEVSIGNFNGSTNINGDLTFKNNKADIWGGAIYCYNDINITGVTGTVSFIENTVDGSVPSGSYLTSGGGGGAICSGGGNITIGGNNENQAIGNLIFDSNQAVGDGGAIYAATDMGGNGGNVIISNVTGMVSFTNNTAYNGISYRGCGGAIYSVTNVTIGADGAIGSLTFDNNNSHWGGAICSDYESVSISNVTGAVSFTKNKAIVSDGTNGAGGAIYANEDVTIGAAGTIGSLTFDSNKSVWGGAIYSYDGNVSISNVTGAVSFTKNKAINSDGTDGAGGAIYADANVTIGTDGTIGSLTFDNNKSYWGGAINCALGHVSISNVTGSISFTNNSAIVDGGAICAWGDTGVTIEHYNGAVNFTNNTTGGVGGAINSNQFHFSGDGATFTFSGNKAGNTANDIYIEHAITDKPSTISGKSVFKFAGGITYADKVYEDTGQNVFNLQISGGANVQFGAGSTNATSALTITDSSFMIDLNDGTTFHTGSLTATGTNNMTVFSTISSTSETENVITTDSTIDTTTLASFAPTVILGAGAAPKTYGVLDIADNPTDSSKQNLIVKVETASANVINMATKTGGPTVNDAYDESGSANQHIVVTADTQENDTLKLLTTTTLVNTSDASDKKSTLNLHSNSADIRHVNSSTTGSGETATLNPILSNTEGDTYLTVNNIEFDGYAINAADKNVYLAGKNITMNHKSGSLDSEAVITAKTLYLQDADVTFGSTLASNLDSDSSSIITVGTAGASTDEPLIIQGDFTSNGTTINMDIFSTSDYDTIEVTGAASKLTLKDTLFNLTSKDNKTYDDGTTFDLLKFTNKTDVDLDTLLVNMATKNNQAWLFSVEGSEGSYSLRITATYVPEPSTWALLILGAAGMMWLRRKK